MQKEILTLHSYFPSLIGAAINPDHSTVEDILTKKCYEIEKKTKSGGQDWISRDTYNTLGTYHLGTDPDFSSVNEFVADQVAHYCKAQNIDLTCLNAKPVDAWMNIYRKHDFQELHTHNDSMISASYYLRCNDSSAKIYFKHPVIDMMPPRILSYNHLNYGVAHFKPQPGMVLIFRSYLYHGVEKQKNNDIRINLSYNFRRKYE